MMNKTCFFAALTAFVTLFSCIKAEVDVETINIGGSEFYVEVGKTITINAVIVPSTASDAALTWTVDDPSVATVADGVVSGLAIGETRLVVSAESGVTASSTIHVTPVVEGISLPAALTVYVGGSTTLVPKFSPDGVVYSEVEWTVENPSVATVSQTGIVTGVKGGRTVVTAVCGEYTASCEIKVREAALGVELDRTEALLLFGGEPLVLVPLVTPENSIDYDLEWSSSDETVAKVTENGEVIPVAPGEADIKVVVDRKHEAVCHVTIVQPIEGISLNETKKTLRVGEETLSLVATVKTQYEGVDMRVVWRSLDHNVASVDENGNVTPLKAGETWIVAETVIGGFSASCKVTVEQPVLGISLDRQEINLNPGVSTVLVAKVYPSDATDMSLEWRSSDETVVTVDQNGVVTGRVDAVVGSSAVVTAKSKDSGVEASCVVFVTLDVTGVFLDVTYRRMTVGESFGLVHTLAPANALVRNVSWTTSDAAVAVVDDNGLVTARGTGAAVITVTTEQNGCTAACRVVVREKGSSDMEGFEEENEIEWN